MSYNLSAHIDRTAIVRRIEQEIEADSILEYEEGHRTHLGASIIGKDCWRYSWNTFRWIKKEKFSGRMHRLFQRGHTEEPKFIHRLRRIGFEVHDMDPETGKQFRISGSGGHYGGSFDGIGKFPPAYGWPDWLVIEFKTHGDKSFKALKKDGVKKSKPVHFRQMSQYGLNYGIKFGLYCAINKNDDEFHWEVVELDFIDARIQLEKADQIILSQVPPPKIAESPAFFDCKRCAFAGNCHAQQLPEKNCRSCIHASPRDNAEWYCRVHDGIIPKDFIPSGCDKWTSIL